jgi:hypothetical protein
MDMLVADSWVDPVAAIAYWSGGRETAVKPLAVLTAPERVSYHRLAMAHPRLVSGAVDVWTETERFVRDPARCWMEAADVADQVADRESARLGLPIAAMKAEMRGARLDPDIPYVFLRMSYTLGRDVPPEALGSMS